MSPLRAICRHDLHDPFTAIALRAAGAVGLVPSAETIPLVYVLGFSNGVLGAFASRPSRGWRCWARAVAVAHLYALYTWILFPVIARALARQISTRRDWSRTEREPISARRARAGRLDR